MGHGGRGKGGSFCNRESLFPYLGALESSKISAKSNRCERSLMVRTIEDESENKQHTALNDRVEK